MSANLSGRIHWIVLLESGFLESEDGEDFVVASAAKIRTTLAGAGRLSPLGGCAEAALADF